ADPSGVFLEQLPDTLATQPQSAPREQQPLAGRATALDDLRSLVLEIIRDRELRAAAQRHQALSVAFASAAAVAFIEVQVTEPQIRYFRSPAAGGVQQLQQGPVAMP